MRKRLLQFVMALMLCIAVFPLKTDACGGFVAIKGEKVFHSIYCDAIEFENLDNMRWFDTASKAEKSGLEMCELCSDYYDLDFDSEYCDGYWTTSDHLLLTAMELSMEYGIYSSEEYWYERFYDQYGYLEDSDGYSFGYQEGYSKGHNQGYNSGYQIGYVDGEAGVPVEEGFLPDTEILVDDAYNSGYEEGFNDGQTQGAGFDVLTFKQETEAEYQRIFELEIERSERKIKNQTILFVLIIVIPILLAFGSVIILSVSTRSKFEKEISELKEKQMDQHEATYVLNMIAKRSGLTTTAMAESLYINFRKAAGLSEEAARAELQKEKQNLPQIK